jgi:hypothetical protein
MRSSSVAFKQQGGMNSDEGSEIRIALQGREISIRALGYR